MGSGDPVVVREPLDGLDFAFLLEGFDRLLLARINGPADGFGGWIEDRAVADPQFVSAVDDGAPEEGVECGGGFETAFVGDVAAFEVGIEGVGGDEFHAEGEQHVGRADRKSVAADAGAFG